VISVVVADDTPTVRLLLSKVLERDGRCTVVAEAADGIEAIQKVEALHPDVLLLDLAMPNMDGLEVLRHYNAVGDGPVIVVVSGFAGGVDQTALSLGAASYFDKTGDLFKLPDEIAHVLDDAPVSAPAND
jgi:CheY-like chemotaxis protein